jgi:hypothetical protein
LKQSYLFVHATLFSFMIFTLPLIAVKRNKMEMQTD